jgi:DNA-binding Lrp family transcriptional regulator
MIISYIFINCYPDEEFNLAEFLRKLPAVGEIFITTGENDVICRVITDTLDELYHLTSSVLENRNEIRSMRTSVVMKELNP